MASYLNSRIDPIDADEPFTVFLSDGRRFLLKDHHWISAHPSRKSNSIRIFGPGDEEEHFIPVSAITSLSKNGRQ